MVLQMPNAVLWMPAMEIIWIILLACIGGSDQSSSVRWVDFRLVFRFSALRTDIIVESIPLFK